MKLGIQGKTALLDVLTLDARMNTIYSERIQIDIYITTQTNIQVKVIHHHAITKTWYNVPSQQCSTNKWLCKEADKLLISEEWKKKRSQRPFDHRM